MCCLKVEHIRCLSVDVGGTKPVDFAGTADKLLAELAGDWEDGTVAYHGRYRWRPTFVSVDSPSQSVDPPLAAGDVCLITGGLGGIGYALAEHLAETVTGVRLALLSRSGYPQGAPGHRPA